MTHFASGLNYIFDRKQWLHCDFGLKWHFLSCGHYISKVGPPDFKLPSELILLKNFVSHHAKGIPSLPKLRDALWESMAESDMGSIAQPRNKANST